MAIALYFAPGSMTAAQYDDIIRQLKAANAGHPAGRTYHACFGEGDKLQVFDVWDSQATFDAFGATLMPILQGLGVEGQPKIAPVHSVIVPPVKAPRPAPAKAAPRPKARAKAPKAKTKARKPAAKKKAARKAKRRK